MNRAGTLAGIALIVVAAVAVVRIQFGGEIKAMHHRGEIPGAAGVPFFPAPDPRADALLAATREALERLVQEAAQAPATAQAPDDDDSAAAPRDPPLTVALLAERHPALLDVGADERWILTLYVTNPGKGRIDPAIADLQDGVLAAARSLLDGLPEGMRTAQALATARLKVDLVVGQERDLPLDGGHRGVALDEGLDGIVLRHPDEPDFWFPPSLAVERKVARDKVHGRARAYAREIGGWKRARTKDDEVSWAAFRTRSWVEAKAGGSDGLVVGLARGNADVPEITPDLLRERIAMGAAFLVRETSADGAITYEYQAGEDTQPGDDYNILRHAGTVYAMMQAYRLSLDPAILDASRRAVDFYRRAMKEDEDHPGEFFVRDVGHLDARGLPRIGRKAKLGGIGLGLCMLVELEKAARGSVDMDLARGMGRNIQRMQAQDGSFQSFYDWDGRETDLHNSTFYSGEAILGLLRLHQLTGERQWLDTAIRGADYLVRRRWRSLGIQVYTPPDAWLLQALEELDRVEPDRRREEYAFAVGEMIARHKLMDPDVTPPDLVGADIAGPGSLPNSATAGSYGEALSAAARLEARRRPGETRFLTFALRNASFQLRNQFWGPNEYFLPNPERAHGGFRLKPDDAEIRNDYVQHNMSGLFGLLDLLDESAPDIGATVHGGSSAAAGGASP